MNDAQIADLTTWVARSGLEGMVQADLISGFCDRAVAIGMPLVRASFIIDTLHPVYEGHAVTWMRKEKTARLTDFGRTEAAEAAESWRRSPFYHLNQTGETMLRRRLNAQNEPEFPVFKDLREIGVTDYVAFASRFGKGEVISALEGVLSSWATDAPEGFSDAHLTALQRLMPVVALAVKARSLARIAGTLVETYLGRDAGRRVLRGNIARGVADRIETVLWFSDLRGYTPLTESAQPEQIIPMLNDYAETIISRIQEQGGDVMKFIGDGLVAIFAAEDHGAAARAALSAANAARRGIAELNRRRAAENLPVTDMYLGLHVGEVFYGNIGSKERLDFTVVGPAVNQTSRIAAMCRTLEQPMLVSSEFAAALGDAAKDLVSVGRYALRGVGRAQDLFALDPALLKAPPA